MNTLTEKDIDMFFAHQVFIHLDIPRITAYQLLMVNAGLKIQSIYYEKNNDQYIIRPVGKHSIFTVEPQHPFYECIFNHTIAYKLSGRDEPDIIGKAG